MKNKYIKPILETEEVLERLALTCGKTSDDGSGGRGGSACNGGELAS